MSNNQIQFNTKAVVSSNSELTLAVLKNEFGRKTARFVRVVAIDPVSQIVTTADFHDPDAPHENLPVWDGYTDASGTPKHMICETPQGAWEYAKMHGFKVQALQS
ncbi:hypothetical protein DSM25558_4679 [Agrobacterium sp. DSM 25558]|uniref:hypothetical protein n=1 Tax=Agrobacterium sp. DSM 25558 TaxID=1907665 RepID=UPI0009724EF8|nr:hypothetical protein [Agrobacterium sp. DSM 25558]SCX29404.1 hypothetical protein DSM25558_4679 [Agrobacterium sp. DSM 25558]